jgi:hypothetical protein
VPPAYGAPTLSGGLTPTTILGLQRTAGNAAVGRLLLRQTTAEQERRAAAMTAWERETEAARLISEHSPGGMQGFLRSEALGAALVARLPGDADIAIRVIDQLVQGWKDNDVSIGICMAASDNKLVEIARDAGGAALMFRMVRSMQGFTTSAGEKAQLYRAMTAITRARAGPPVSVEVITFRSGFGVLDWLGETVFGKGAKGHTAVVASGLVYSFDERGWVMEGSKAEYLGRNTHRDAIGQVLRVPPDDGAKILDGLNKAIGHGTYLLSGDVCTDASAKLVEAVLGKLDAKHNPQEFANMLDASGHVESTNNYPKRQ